jgi:hypothetical protein
MGCAPGNHYDPAISRTDALPISGPLAALDLMHIQYRRCGTARGLVSQPQSGADPLPHWYGVPCGTTQLSRNRDSLLRRQVREPQRSWRDGKGGVTKPLGFGVATGGVQRQVDRPPLEANAGEKRRNLSKIIGPDPMALH